MRMLLIVALDNMTTQISVPQTVYKSAWRAKRRFVMEYIMSQFSQLRLHSGVTTQTAVVDHSITSGRYNTIPMRSSEEAQYVQK